MNGRQEVLDQGSMSIMGEIHDVGTATGSAIRLDGDLLAVSKRDLQVATGENRHTQLTDDLDCFGPSGIHRGSREYRSRRAVSESHQCTRVVLSFHAVNRGRDYLGGLYRADANQRAEQVERMDGLRE